MNNHYYEGPTFKLLRGSWGPGTFTPCQLFARIHKLCEAAVKSIPAIRNKAKIIFTCINAIVNEKTTSVFCVTWVLYSPPQSDVQIN